MNRATLLKGVVLAAALIGTASAAWSGPQIQGADITLNGIYEQTRAFGRQPFVMQVFAQSGECLNAQVTSETADLHMAVIGSSGTVWRNDDGGGACPACPRVKADPTSGRGWYTVSISRLGDAAAGDLETFTLLIQRRVTGNAVCATPTPAEGPAQGDKD